MKNKLINFFKKETVFVISGLAATLSALFIPPSLEYIGYIDFQVIALLFCLMAVVAGLREIGLFEVLSQRLLRIGTSVRFVSIILVVLCFFFAMLVTNDVALITMVPFTLSALDFVSEKRIIFIVVMETIAANLGSMLTPIGNPQNLYLFSNFNVNIIEFFKITFPITVVSLALIIAFVLAIKSQKLKIVFDVESKIQNKFKLSVYILLFLICLSAVIGVINYKLMFIAVFFSILYIDKMLLKQVDYFLLFNFIFFFIFVGNIGRIEQIQEFLHEIIQGRVFIFSAALSQVISNVPAAVMLSGFTNNFKELILGTNIGGLGTIIASLASLISFKLYSQSKNANNYLYLMLFSVINIMFIVILIPLCYKIYM